MVREKRSPEQTIIGFLFFYHAVIEDFRRISFSWNFIFKIKFEYDEKAKSEANVKDDRFFIRPIFPVYSALRQAKKTKFIAENKFRSVTDMSIVMK